jgi:hypothetical protein
MVWSCVRLNADLQQIVVMMLVKVKYIDVMEPAFNAAEAEASMNVNSIRNAFLENSASMVYVRNKSILCFKQI